MIKDVAIICAIILFTILIYILSLKICRKYKYDFMNPILVAAVIIITILLLFKIPYSDYNRGGSVIASALGPIVVVLAIPMYKNRNEIKKNFIPIMGGITASVLTSFGTVYGLCKLFKIDFEIMLSILPKSITTPMAIESSKILGASEPITITVVVITGILGSALAPTIIKYSRLKSDIAKGIGIGSSSHAIGTSKALEMGEEIGAASSLSIGVTGLITIILIIIFS